MQKNVVLAIGKLLKLLAANPDASEQILTDFFKNAPSDINTERKLISVFGEIYAGVFGSAVKNMLIAQFTGEDFVKAMKVWPVLKTISGYKNLIPRKFVETFDGEVLELPM